MAVSATRYVRGPVTNADIDNLLDENLYFLKQAEVSFYVGFRNNREFHERILRKDLEIFFGRTFARQYNGNAQNYRKEFVDTLFSAIVEDAERAEKKRQNAR